MKKLYILIAVLACVGKVKSVYAASGTWTHTTTAGPTQTAVYVSELAGAGCTGPCPYYNAPNPNQGATGTASGQTVTTYTLTGNIAWKWIVISCGLTGGATLASTTAASGSSTVTLNSWCTCGEVDLDKNTTSTTVTATQTSISGQILQSNTSTLTTVSSLYPNPVKSTQAGCNPNCPPAQG
jgi:hypothetical protein